jgi:hypothetical protein
MIKDAKFFILNGHSASAALADIIKDLGIDEKSAIEDEADRVVAEYLPQIDKKIRTDAMRMSEFYRIFYALENSIRIFIVDILTDTDANWWANKVPEHVRKKAEDLRKKELNEGVTVRSQNLIEYTSFGELGEIVKQNWDVFGGIFTSGSIAAVEKIMARLNMLRGPIAHCGILGEEEVLRLKLTIRDWFRLAQGSPN